MRGGSLVRGIVSLTIAASLFALAEPTAADQITDHISQEQRQLNQAKAEIASLKAQIAAAQNQETALTSIITGLNHQIASTQAQVAAANAKLDAINTQLTAAQSQLAEARALLGTEEHELSQELVVYYEFENQSRRSATCWHRVASTSSGRTSSTADASAPARCRRWTSSPRNAMRCRRMSSASARPAATAAVLGQLYLTSSRSTTTSRPHGGCRVSQADPGSG